MFRARSALTTAPVPTQMWFLDRSNASAISPNLVKVANTALTEAIQINRIDFNLLGRFFLAGAAHQRWSCPKNVGVVQKMAIDSLPSYRSDSSNNNSSKQGFIAMFVGICSKSPQLSALLIGASVLLGSGAIDIARADTDLGAVNITLTVNPGAPDQGGGPFQFALGQVSGGANLSALGIPSSVISWCVETTQNIGGGAQNITSCVSTRRHRKSVV